VFLPGPKLEPKNAAPSNAAWADAAQANFFLRARRLTAGTNIITV
jgi:hypothetical protein